MGVLACALVVVDCVVAVTALGAPAPGLPRTYTVQRVDSPLPFVNSRFGAGMINLGDASVPPDGEDDFATVQTAGTANGNNGAIYLHSGETGTLIRQANMPDMGNTVAGSLDQSIVDPNIDRLQDLGSCVGGVAGMTCGTNPIGPPDGVNELLVGAQGVDVGTQRDVGRAYVFDGATFAVLKRIDMPAVDRATQTAIIAAQPSTLNLRAGGFGRTVQSPRGLPPCDNNAGVGDCPAVGTAFPAVSAASRIGDMDGGGRGEIVVGSNRFHETSATAYPTSQCASSPLNTFCFEAGRTYIFRGEDVFNSNPNTNLDTPLTTLRNPAAQGQLPDFGVVQNTEIENFGHVQIPVGDVGQCRSGGMFPVATPNDPCLPTSSTNTADGFPELLVASHRADIPTDDPDPAWFDVGVIFLVDGATRSILYTFQHPEPQPGSGFGFTLHTPFPFGDMGPNVATDNPDWLAAAFTQTVNSVTGAGRAYLMNGNFKGGPNVYSFGALNDPTPTVGGNFGTAGSALGDLVPGTATLKNEVIVGGFASARARDDAITDVNIFNTFYERRLQQIQDPDQQPNSKFGSRVAPLGDLNEDGFLDYAIASDGWDTPGGVDNNNGRIFIFRSDNSPVPVQQNPPANNPAPNNPDPTPPATPPADVGVVPATPTPIPAAVTRAGRRITLRASDTRISSSDEVRLSGTISELVNNSGCRGSQRVAIQRSTSADGPYTTFRRVTTSSRGTFGLTLEPTRTYRYRALVSVSATCLRATSSSTRVRVASRTR